MNDYVINNYKKMKEYLLKANSEDTDIEILSHKVRCLEENYFNEMGKHMASNEFELENQNAVWGLIKKYKRLHDEFAIGRNYISKLSYNHELFFCNNSSACPYTEEDFSGIQKKIIYFIKDECSKTILTGNVKTRLSENQKQHIIGNLIQISHSITDYVNYYDDGSWNWQADNLFIIQYVFEKAAEITYKVIKGETTDELSYDITEAFSYFQVSVPEDFQVKIDSVVDILENIESDITSFVEKNDYNLCDKEIWLRTIIFNIALVGVRYALEQDI